MGGAWGLTTDFCGFWLRGGVGGGVAALGSQASHAAAGGCQRNNLKVPVGTTLLPTRALSGVTTLLPTGGTLRCHYPATDGGGYFDFLGLGILVSILGCLFGIAILRR